MQYLLFDGILNQTFLGLQAYLWLILAMFLVAATTYCLWLFFFWLPLKPVHGHFIAHISKINSALVFDDTLKFDMRSEKKAKLIYDESVADARSQQKDWDYAPSGLIGRVQNDLIFDGGKWTDLKSPIRAEIERLAGIYNEGNPQDEIHTLDKFYRCAIDGKLGGITVDNTGRKFLGIIPLTYRVEWKRIDFAIPPNHVQTQWDGYLRQLAKTLNEDTNSDLSMYGYIILGMAALIDIGMLAIKFMK